MVPLDNLLQSKWTPSEVNDPLFVRDLSARLLSRQEKEKCYKMARVLLVVLNLNEMESESDCEAVGECIIDEEHRAEDEEAVFRWVYDYLAEKKYPDGASKDTKQAVRKKAQRYSCIVCIFYAGKV